VEIQDVVIVSACRTAIGKFLGSLKDVPARDLAIAAGKGAIERAGISAEDIDEISMGQCLPGMQGSLQIIAIANDILGFLRAATRGVEVNDETLALDVIKMVGPKGHYLNLPHTREHLRKLEFSEMVLASLGNQVDAIQFAREKTDWILDNHFPQPLEENQQRELKRIIQTAESR